MKEIWTPIIMKGVEPFENKFDTWEEVINYFGDMKNALDIVELDSGLYDVLGVFPGDYYIQSYLGDYSDNKGWWIAYKYRDSGFNPDMYYHELTPSSLKLSPILKNLVWTPSVSRNYWGMGDFYKVNIDYNINGFNFINWPLRNPMEVKE